MLNIIEKLLFKSENDVTEQKRREKYGTFSSIVGIATNVILAAFKLIAGLLSGSVAIIADSVNNFSDAGSSGVSLLSFKIASKPADRDHPFGHARIEYIASLIVSFLIIHVGLDLFMDSASNIFKGSAIDGLQIQTLTIVILSVSIVMKLWLALFYSGVAKKINSTVIKAAAADSLSDSVSTTAVLASSLIVYFTDLVIIDAIVGLAVSILIVIAGGKILLETSNSILGESPVEDTVQNIEKIVSEYPQIIGVHDMLVHNYGPGHYLASFHAEVDGEDDIYELHDTIDNIEKRISSELNIQCTIHLDPVAVNDPTVAEYISLVKNCIAEIDPIITVHDFRAVIGMTHTNLIFDIVLPFESKLTVKDAKRLISDAVSSKNPNLFCVITVDRG